jgi:copper chaperone
LLSVQAGETVAFEVRNPGALPHEFFIGTAAEQQAHERDMAGGVPMPWSTAATYPAITPRACAARSPSPQPEPPQEGVHAMATTVLNVPDISCEHCERTITNALTPVEGVGTISVDIPARQVRVDYDESVVDVSTMQ